MNEVLRILEDTDALRTHGHFVGTSGRHMEVYVNKDRLYPHTARVSRIGELFAERYANDDITAVVAPAIGGVVLAQWAAYHLARLRGADVLALYSEKTPDGTQIFRRGYDAFVRGKRVLVVEDTVTTGQSVKQTADAVTRAGGTVVAVSVMINRDPEHIDARRMGYPFSSLALLPAESWSADTCPLCKKGMPIDASVGHGGRSAERNS